MEILHGTWIPNETEEFIQSGGFYLWVETTAVKKNKKSLSHIERLSGKDLATFLERDLGIKNLQSKAISSKSKYEAIASKYFLLPTVKDRPLPSLELTRYLETDIPEEFTWQYWEIDCYSLPQSWWCGDYPH